MTEVEESKEAAKLTVSTTVAEPTVEAPAVAATEQPAEALVAQAEVSVEAPVIQAEAKIEETVKAEPKLAQQTEEIKA
ncbi:MAG: hypothetical protein ABIA21_00430 [Candidatus Aenigmatarchaeota archaeon]